MSQAAHVDRTPVAANDSVTVVLTEYDAGRMNALTQHFKRVSPDLPPPSPEVILLMALDELHLQRIGHAPGGGSWITLARPVG